MRQKYVIPAAVSVMVVVIAVIAAFVLARSGRDTDSHGPEHQHGEIQGHNGDG